MSTGFSVWPRAGFLILVALAACSAGEPNPPPPPPPPAALPASVSAQSALVQDAEPGVAVAVRPAVLVRDAGGRPLANVAVTFAVDSGAGTVTGASVVTGADGVATVGEWRLGPAEGRQVLAAGVGALPPVRFVAVAMTAPVTLPPQVVAAGGGTVTLTRPGSAVDGLTITVPPGAIVGGTTLTMGLRSAAAAVLPSGYQLPGPIVRLSAPGAVLGEPVLVSVPLREQPNTVRFVAVVDGATGRLIPLPVVEWTATTITVALPVLDPSAQAAALPAVRAGDPPDLVELLGGFFDALLPEVGDLDTGFRPGVDDWDFRRQPIAGIPGFSPGPTVDPAAAMIESARWYFLNRKGADGPLGQRFQLVRGVPESNRAGLRWMGVAGSRLPRALENSVTYNRLRVLWSTPGAGLDHLKLLQGIKQQMAGGISFTGGPRGPRAPVPVMLFAGTSLESPRFALAFRAEGNRLDLAIPDEPGRTVGVEFSATGITPFMVSTIGGGTFTVTGISPASMELSNGLRNDLRLPEEWPRVADGTIGNAEGWRTFRLRGWFRPDVGSPRVVDLDRADVPVLDDFQHWWECVGCAENGFRVGIPGANVNPLLFRLLLPLGSTGSAPLPADLFTKAEVAATDLAPAATQTGGFALYLAGPGSGLDIPQGTSWFDWTTIRYRQVPVALTPEQHVATQDGPVTFTAAVTGAPTGATYRWDFEGATDPVSGALLVKETFDTPTPTLTYGLQQTKMAVVAGRRVGKMKVRVLDANGRPVGSDEVFVEMAGDQLAWRLESFSSTHRTGPDPDFDAVIANPSDWVVFVFLKAVPGMPTGIPTPGVYLQRRPGPADVAVTFATSGATTVPLAHLVVNPAARVTGTYSWTGDVGSGDVIGTGTPLNQTCTQYLGAITATKASELLSGEISRHITRLAACDGGLLDVVNRATFRARRLPSR